MHPDTQKASAQIPQACGSYLKSILWYPQRVHDKVLQIYKSGLEFALVSDENAQCHPFVLCKDFLHDVAFSCVHGRNIDIYRFQYNPHAQPNCCFRQTRILFSNSKDWDLQERILGLKDFVNQIESSLKMRKSVVRRCKNPPAAYRRSGVFLIQSNRRWIASPPMLSLFALLLRVGLVHRQGDHYKATIRAIINGDVASYQKKDRKWLRLIEPVLHKIIRLGDRRLFCGGLRSNYPNLPIEDVHNSLGVVGLASDMVAARIGRQVYVPQWHRLR